MPVQLLLEEYAVHQGRNFTKNQVQNLYNNVTGTANYVVSTRSLKTKVHVIYSIQFRLGTPLTWPENHVKIPLFKINHNFFKVSFFPSTIIKRNNLDPNLRNSDTYGTSKNTILKFIRPSPNNVFECHNPQVIKFLTRLRFGLSYPREHKFKHSFQDSLNPVCKCGAEVESTFDFLLHCPIYNNDRSSLLCTIRNINCKLLEITNSSLTQTLLYGKPSFDIITNLLILNATISFLSSKRSEGTLFKRNNVFSYVFLNNRSINLLFRQ